MNQKKAPCFFGAIWLWNLEARVSDRAWPETEHALESRQKSQFVKEDKGQIMEQREIKTKKRDRVSQCLCFGG